MPRLPELEVIGPINFAHSATPEQAYDSIAIGQDRSGSETSCRDRV